MQFIDNEIHKHIKCLGLQYRLRFVVCIASIKCFWDVCNNALINLIVQEGHSWNLFFWLFWGMKLQVFTSVLKLVLNYFLIKYLRTPFAIFNPLEYDTGLTKTSVTSLSINIFNTPDIYLNNHLLQNTEHCKIVTCPLSNFLSKITASPSSRLSFCLCIDYW